MKRYDAIIVGSGAAGMTSAILLAKQGRKVLVLEQHTKHGGLMASFRRNDILIPTGVHCLGSLSEGQILWRQLKYLGVLDRLSLIPMKPDGFQEYCFPMKTFLLPYGHNPFRSRLVDYFPAEKQAIDQIMDDIKEVTACFSLYNLETEPKRPTDLMYQPLEEYLDGLSENKEFKAVLTAINPMYGVRPEECPLYVHFLVLDSFLNSAWKVDEYETPLADAFFAALREVGGKVLCGRLVVSFECENRKIKGVTLEDGSRIEAETVIFTGHPRALVDLCPPGELRPAFKDRMRQAPDTPGAFGIAVSSRYPEQALEKTDRFLYNSWNTSAQYDQNLLSSEVPPNMVYLSSLKNRRNNEATLVALLCMQGQQWAPWQESRTGRRPQDYLSLKQTLAQRIFSVVKEQCEETAIELVDCYTPLTFKDYTLAPQGTAYGLMKGVQTYRSSRVSAKTRIHGLYLAGQSVVLPGVLGAVTSGVAACCSILGHTSLVTQIAEETA